MTRDELPTTYGEALRHWLGYRYPHYDEMEARAAATLTGTRTAAVRVGWDGGTRTPREWHATLFTLTDETPEPGRTRTAAETMKPAGMLLHHVVSVGARADATTPNNTQILEITDALRNARAAVRRAAIAASDSRTPLKSRQRLSKSAAGRVAGALKEIEQAITSGLRERCGLLLIPPMIAKPVMLADWLSYQALLDLRARLDPGRAGTWRPEGIAVCRGCTTVFVPRRRRTAEFCRLCSKRPATCEVLGQRSLMSDETRTVRAPKLTGNLIVGWKSATVSMCPECGQPFIGRKDSTTCQTCAPRVRQRRRRGAGETRLHPLPE